MDFNFDLSNAAVNFKFDKKKKKLVWKCSA